MTRPPIASIVFSVVWNQMYHIPEDNNYPGRPNTAAKGPRVFTARIQKTGNSIVFIKL
jgi:hypothetical protein